MTTRLLPEDEWARVSHTDLAQFLPYVDPSRAQVIVVEDAGRVVGCWAVVQMTHVEGLWIDPDYRGSVGVARRLWVTTMAAARRVAARWVMTGSQQPEIAQMLLKAGAVQIPMDTFVMPVAGGK